ncbi:DUF1048 domain-containing protein [Shimazuella sp. AN120528]|uniref:DUF1048 domain-containing protein n=1 Tax=Shimazuella soli TaxID=1892854 RepID=UPI001F0E3C8A|nr:DUF1048 domain-containing protein [Shimazuella soli]MCH5585208.1 DUF1048 domain-containing protein [Shimazuella soli]
MEKNIFSKLIDLAIGAKWKQEREEYKRYKKRMNDLSKDYRIVMKEIENYLLTFASDTESTMAIFKALRDILELFESSAQERKDVLDVVGQDIGGFCDDLLQQLQVQTWTEKRKQQWSDNIRKKFSKGA